MTQKIVPTISGIKVKCAYDEIADPKELKPHPENPNTHSKEQLTLYHKIVTFQGWRRAITVSKRSGLITRGHGALEMALMFNIDGVPVDYQDYDSEMEEKADLVADNALAKLAVMDTKKQTALIAQIDLADFDIELVGIPQETIDKMLAAASEPPQLNIPPGGEASNSLGDDAPPPEEAPPTPAGASHVRMVQLFLSEENIQEFMGYIEHFQKAHGTENVTDTVLAVLRKAKADEPAPVS